MAGSHTSRKAGSHRKAGLHRRQGLAHYTKAGSHRRQGGAKPSLATGMPITYDAMQGLTQ